MSVSESSLVSGRHCHTSGSSFSVSGQESQGLEGGLGGQRVVGRTCEPDRSWRSTGTGDGLRMIGDVANAMGPGYGTWLPSLTLLLCSRHPPTSLPPPQVPTWCPTWCC